jgi:hypothetical protein
MPPDDASATPPVMTRRCEAELPPAPRPRPRPRPLYFRAGFFALSAPAPAAPPAAASAASSAAPPAASSPALLSASLGLPLKRGLGGLAGGASWWESACSNWST